MIRGSQERSARRRYCQMAPVLNEQSLRRYVAMEARSLGHGGVSAMSRISGLARSTIYHGLSDIRDRITAVHTSSTPSPTTSEGSASAPIPKLPVSPCIRSPDVEGP